MLVGVVFTSVTSVSLCRMILLPPRFFVLEICSLSVLGVFFRTTLHIVGWQAQQ